VGGEGGHGVRTYVVTGDCGFIGRHLCAALASQEIDARVIGLDVKTGDDVLDCILPDCDVCYHLAAQTDARCSDAVEDARVNVLGSVRVFQRYRDRCVFASSCAVNYPVTPYAVSKLACEHYARMFGVRVVRLCNIFGLGGHGVHEKFAAAPRMHISGDGTQLRTYAPVLSAIIALIDARESLHVLRGEDLTVNQVADFFFPKPRLFVPRAANDIQDGRQLYPS